MAVKNYEEFTLFDMIMPRYQIDPNKKLRLISTFSGYDSQALALKYLGVDFEHYRTCEWAVKSIQALKDLHFGNDNTDYSKEYNLEYIYNYLYNKGISSNYNEPMKMDQIKRLGEERARTIYNNIQATKNMVNIQQVKAEDLAIVEKDKYEYLFTYSFPCQDLSLAGLRKGMKKGESTRSGMLWEVERILEECKELNALPNILFMENVPEVIGKNNIKDFQKWIEKLESLGYSNYVECLNSKDYGIPQNRNRCFMISVLGEYSYKFPQPFELKLRLKDLLESNVDEKYFLSKKMIDFFDENSKKNEEKGNGFRFLPQSKDECNIAKCITTRSGSRMDDNFIKIVGQIEKWHQRGTVYDPLHIAPTICATDYKTPKLIQVGEQQPCIIMPEKTKKGYVEANEGDGVYINRPHQKRGCVQKDMIPTLTTQVDNDLAVVVKDDTPNLKQQMCNQLIQDGKVKENDVIRHSYSTSRMNGEMKDIQTNNIAPTLDTRCDCLGVVVKEDLQPKLVGGIGEKKSNNGTQYYQQDRIYDGNGVAMCHPASLPSGSYMYQLSNLRIRKLTPRETFRLMGVKDEDFDKIKNNQSDSSLWHLAGDSIVVDVMYYMFKNLF